MQSFGEPEQSASGNSDPDNDPTSARHCLFFGVKS
jgi:hypothetical protein